MLKTVSVEEGSLSVTDEHSKALLLFAVRERRSTTAIMSVTASIDCCSPHVSFDQYHSTWPSGHARRVCIIRQVVKAHPNLRVTHARSRSRLLESIDLNRFIIER